MTRPCTGSLRGVTRNGEPGEYRSPDAPGPRNNRERSHLWRCLAGVPMAATATRPELLLHADFVRGLARALVGADGEDVAQQAWVRALQAAPPRGDARAFLTTIVRRLAQNRLRSERRRSAREAAAVAAEPGPTPEQVLAREEVRKRVVDAVLALDEPFRQVVLLRFYDDLAPRAIAQRLGVPPATVRTRLLRALDKLRARLDAEHGGGVDRAAPAVARHAQPGRSTGHDARHEESV